METIDFNQVIKDNISVVGELLPVVSMNNNGLLSKNNCITYHDSGNRVVKFSYEYDSLFKIELIGEIQSGGKCFFAAVSLSKSQYGKNFEIISSKDLNNTIVKYLDTDNTLDFYIETGNLEFLQFGLAGTSTKLIGINSVEKSDVPVEAVDVKRTKLG